MCASEREDNSVLAGPGMVKMVRKCIQRGDPIDMAYQFIEKVFQSNCFYFPHIPEQLADKPKLPVPKVAGDANKWAGEDEEEEVKVCRGLSELP